MTETVTRLRPTTTSDRYGNTTSDWGDPERLNITGCLIEPRVEPEDATNGREGRVIGWNVYAPDGTDVAATDKVEVRGTAYTVDGEPEDWSGGWDWRPGVVIKLRAGVG